MFRAFKHSRNSSGVSLVELLITITILAIITGIAVPLFISQSQRAHGTSLNGDGKINNDPRYGAVKVDDTQYKQCEGSDLNFKSIQGDNLLSVSHNDPACL